MILIPVFIFALLVALVVVHGDSFIPHDLFHRIPHQ